MKAGVFGGYEDNRKFSISVLAARQKALGVAVEKVRERLIADERLPYRKGRLTNYTATDLSKLRQESRALLVSNTPYAAKLYLHPEYRFRKRVNKNAGGRWFDPFINGANRGLLEREYAKELARILK